jgi:hypothetical protein
MEEGKGMSITMQFDESGMALVVRFEPGFSVGRVWQHWHALQTEMMVAWDSAPVFQGMPHCQTAYRSWWEGAQQFSIHYTLAGAFGDAVVAPFVKALQDRLDAYAKREGMPRGSAYQPDPPKGFVQ